MASDAETKIPAEFPSYVKADFWINLLFKRGALAVAEVMGLMYLFRALGSVPFALEPALVGTLLLIVGIVVEYLGWTKTTILVSRRIDQLETAKKQMTEEQTKLLADAIASRLRGAQGN